MADNTLRSATSTRGHAHDDAAKHLAEVAALFKREKQGLCREWTNLTFDEGMLPAQSRKELVEDMETLFDRYVEVIERSTTTAQQAYSEALAALLADEDAKAALIVGKQRLLHDVLTRAVVRYCGGQVDKALNLLTSYQEQANRLVLASTERVFQERERTIVEQQEAIRELSTPVLQVRDQLLICPLIGVIDPQRARQVMEQLLHRIRENRARVAVIDITGVPIMDAHVANSLVQTVEACRLLGASVVVSGISPDIAQTLVRIGVNLDKMDTTGDLQGAIEEAERRLGYRLIRDQARTVDEDEEASFDE